MQSRDILCMSTTLNWRAYRNDVIDVGKLRTNDGEISNAELNMIVKRTPQGLLHFSLIHQAHTSVCCHINTVGAYSEQPWPAHEESFYITCSRKSTAFMYMQAT